ncbi:response regulator transcription factor [Streptomyces sp. BHT-5-2]|uniref:response regulator n=1 Tax=unclassified Streptomyces TaxID=2593676 RepID=UPI001C8EA8F0|nr:response regulator transcription factor [Streptomyces sp. BHT-5-2]QZL04590.1 response regulator transcription factor [Streptomyces sp. BHT-5-2]
MTRVLVVEDEPPLVRALEINLKARGFDVDTAPDGAQALRSAAASAPDVVLLDLGLPDMDGIDVIKELRQRNRASILVVSARRTSDEKITALDAGADDYITKPFSMDELLARLRAAARRTDTAKPSDDAPVIVTETFTLDLAAKKARRDGRDVRLTPTEWHLLEVLVRNSGRLVGRHQLLEEVWGTSQRTQTNYLRVYMAQLRRKLETDPAHPKHFFTAPGMGYRFDP